jgi:hypothetical protein
MVAYIKMAARRYAEVGGDQLETSWRVGARDYSRSKAKSRQFAMALDDEPSRVRMWARLVSKQTCDAPRLFTPAG